MPRLRIKALTWLMSIGVFIWFLVTLFSEPDVCTYDLDDTYYYEAHEQETKSPQLEGIQASAYGPKTQETHIDMDNESKKSNLKKNITYSYNQNLPIVFIGGIAGSGLELLRELLNQDSSRIRCGPETRLLTTIIEKNIEWLNIRLEKERLHHAGMTLDIIDSAVAQFILQVLLRHETITPRICNKDIYVFKWAPYLKKLFPNSKFILMMRDPRATVSSLIKRKFQYHNIRLNSYSDALVDWNLVATIFHQRCVEMGSSCRVILYEKLVLNPNATLNEIYRFLDMHEDAHEYSFTEHRNGVDTLLRKVLLKRDNLFSWLNDFPKNLIYVADKLAPLMVTLGYDTTKIVPNNLAYAFNKTV